MPIEIKELVIRATIDPQGEAKQNDTRNRSGNQEELISECVEQVLGILEQQRER